MFGGRRLRRMLQRPLAGAEAIHARQAAVASLAADRAARDALMLAFRSARGAPLARLPGFLAMPRVLRGTWLPIVTAACALLQVAGLLLLGRLPEAVPILVAGLTTSFVLHMALRQRTSLLRDAYRELEPVVRVTRAAAPALAGATDPLLDAAHAVLAREAREAPRIAAALQGLHVQDTGALYPVIELVTGVELL